jgi:hypothetical protein
MLFAHLVFGSAWSRLGSPRRISVCNESQPVALTRVSCTYLQRDADAVPEIWQCLRTYCCVGGAGDRCMTVKLRVAIESQPLELISVSLYVPAAVMLIPFHT